MAALATVTIPAGAAQAAKCDPLDPSACHYPWPSDALTKKDRTTDTGLRLDLKLLDMPRNIAGKPISPREQNRNDGFSPGSALITRVPGLDTPEELAATGAVTLTNLGAYDDPDQPIVVIDARTRERHPVWAEIDINPQDPGKRTLMIRPARNFEEGRRYVVALRNLAVEPGPYFRARRDGAPDERLDPIFKTLEQAGIERSSLFLAWDFTIASERNLSERALQIRDDAFARLGDRNLRDMKVSGRAPRFVMNPDVPDGTTDVRLPEQLDALDDVTGLLDVENLDGRRDFAPCSAGATPACERGESDSIARRVTGQIVVPCYLDLPGCVPGARFRYLSRRSTRVRQIPGNTALANVICQIPRRAVDGRQQVKPVIYGHGLLGGAGEVQGGNQSRMAQDHGYLYCATDWIGMSTYDVPNVATLLADLSRFSTLADRVQQGLLNFMYLGRALIHPEGLSANPAFQVDGRSVIDTERLFYDGNSQGGIIGGALTALAPDFDRAVLGVPAMNYSTLLRRSIDFDTYAVLMYRAYPDELLRPLILQHIQLLWDRAEANGYAHHMTSDPLADTPPHEVLLHVAYGDHQVANVAADVEARTIGAPVHRPLLDPFRPQYLADLIPAIGTFPHDGSAMVYWDTGPLSRPGGRGVGDPPVGNVPPREGRDPHGAPRSDPKAQRQKAAFMQVDGRVIDVCAGGPCYADGWTGASPAQP